MVGDMAALDGLPGVAQVAMQGGRYAAATVDPSAACPVHGVAVPLPGQGLDGHDQPVQSHRPGSAGWT